MEDFYSFFRLNEDNTSGILTGDGAHTNPTHFSGDFYASGDARIPKVLGGKRKKSKKRKKKKHTGEPVPLIRRPLIKGL